MNQTYGLFPIPVASFRLNRKFTKNEMNSIRESLLDLTPNDFNQTSRNRHILDIPELSEIKTFCQESVSDFAKNVMRFDDGDSTITQSWLNLSTTGQQHHQHRHPNSLWSGVLYIVSGQDDRIIFHNERNLNGSFQMNETEWNEFNSHTWWLPAKQCHLLVFQSMLVHSVPPTKSRERISLSFNTFPRRNIGSDSKLSLLELTKVD